jgi:hypothetical protein
MMGAVHSFDPVRLATHEANAWVAYYQRRWATFLRAALGLVREGFVLPLPRANQAWAPYPDNDPDRARAIMRRFYALVAHYHRATFDVDEAARLEVHWWGVHRHLQREAPDDPIEPLTDALAALYAHVYRVPAELVRAAAGHRAEAMRISDAWVEAGADSNSPAVAAEREELIKGYALLRAAVT